MKPKTLAEKWALGGIGPLFAGGAALHFVYGLLGKPAWAGLFCPVNESVFEHLKLGAWPVFAYALLGRAVLKKKQGHTVGWYRGQCAAMGICLSSILLLHYLYAGALGGESPWGDVVVFLLAVALGQAGAVSDLKKSRKESPAALTVMGMVLLLLAVGTFWPPRLPLFWDPLHGGYGLQ